MKVELKEIIKQLTDAIALDDGLWTVILKLGKNYENL